MKDSPFATTWGASEPERTGSTALAHIRVQGAVRAPGEYAFEENADVLHYLQKAGGPAAEASVCKVVILRNYGPQRRTLVFKLDESALVPKVRSGDVLVFDPNAIESIESVESAQAFARNEASIELTQRPQKDYAALSPTEARLRGVEGSAFRTLLEQYIRGPKFKRLLNRIATTQTGANITSLAVLSYHAGEGKSFFTAALALAYAKFLDSHVLILDTNRELSRRSPILEAVAADYSALNGEEGVSDLNRDASFIDLITMESLGRTSDADSDFYVGPYLNSVKDKYDLILVDTCAISSEATTTIDPIVVANQVDSSILITSPLSVHQTAIEGLNGELKRFKPRLMGSVFNSAASQ